MVDTAENIWRDFVTDGVPSTGTNKPKKSKIREWGTWVEEAINAGLSNGGLIYDTKAHLDADLAHDANASAWVIGDSAAANNGIYRKSGASGTGSWTRIGDLPYGLVRLTDVGAGTANAIQLTSTVPTSDQVIRLANVFEANTGDVTISENGAAAIALKTLAGNQVAPGGLPAGAMVAYVFNGTEFRLLSDQASAAIQAAAEAAQAAAEAAAASVNLPAVTALTYLRAKSDASGYDKLTAAQLWDDVSATNKFNQALTGSPWENIAVGGKTARIHRVADRIMLADAVAYTGGNTTGSAGTWLQGVGAGSSKMDYLLINAGLASVTTAYIDSTTGGSSAYAVMGASRVTGKNTGSAIGGAFFGLNDGTSGGAGTNAWGVYGEGAVASLEHRVTVGAEFEITNTAGSFAGQVTPYNGFFKGMLGGIFLGCGGGVGVNTTTYHAHFGLMLAENGQVGSSSFHRGIVILDNALVRDGGVSTGRAHAIVLPPNAAIEWYEADTETLGMSMVSSVLDATHRQTLRVDNTGLTLINADNKATFWAQWVASAVNAPALIPSATGVDVFLAFTGDDANGSVSLLGKGSGGASMRDGANVRKVQVNTTGIGFFGVTPTAQKSMAAATGTATRTTFATFAGQTISASPTQAQVQAIDDHVKILSERLKAMIDDFRSYGLHA